MNAPFAPILGQFRSDSLAPITVIQWSPASAPEPDIQAGAPSDGDGEGFRMPAVTGAAKGKGRRTETAQARTRGAPVRRYGDLRFLLRSNEWRGDCRMRFTRGSWW